MGELKRLLATVPEHRARLDAMTAELHRQLEIRQAIERMNREAPPGLRYHYAPTMREAEDMARRIAREAGLPVTRGTGDTRREPIARLITYPVCVDITLYPNGEHVEDGSVLHRIFYGYWMP